MHMPPDNSRLPDYNWWEQGKIHVSVDASWDLGLPNTPSSVKRARLLNSSLYWSASDSEQWFDDHQVDGLLHGYNKTDITYKFNEYGYRSESFSDLITGPKVLTCGCSYTFGTGLNLEYTWPVMFAKESGRRLFNLANPGSSNEYIARTIYTAIDVIKPDIVIVQWTDKSRFELFYENLPYSAGHWTDNFPDFMLDESQGEYRYKQNLALVTEVCRSRGVRLMQTSIENIWDENVPPEWFTPPLARDSHPAFGWHRWMANEFLSQI